MRLCQGAADQQRFIMHKTKYKNTKIEIDGHKFDSKKEAAHYQKLKLLESQGKISKLQLQPRFKFELNKVNICSYVADFSFIENGKLTVQDVKSAYTSKMAVYRIKNKMMKAFYAIEIEEVL